MSSCASESSTSSSKKEGAPITTKTPGPPSLLRAAGLIAVVTILSKVLGAVRDWQIMNVYGASLPSDAYFSAIQIPSFAIVLLGGLGGPFHTATVAVFSKVLKDSPDAASPQAKKLASAFITLTGLAFFLLSVGVYFFAEPINRMILGDANPALVQNATEQLQIMSPILFFGGLIGIFYGLLNVYHSFFWPSLSPAALSLVMSIALLVNPNDSTGHLLAWSTLLGTVLQFALQLPEFYKRKFTMRPSFNVQEWKSPEIRQVGEMLFPAIVGTTIGQLTTYVDMFFTQFLCEGGWTAVVMGNRLFQLPIGVLQTSFLVPIFPRFTRYVVDQEWGELRRYFRMGVVSLWFISLPMLVGILLYVEPIIRILFQYGRFDADDTHMVAEALIFLSFSMLPYFARDSLTRVFYAFQDSKTPLMVGCIAIGIKAFLDWLLVVQLGIGVGGITFSTALITVINMVLLGVLSKRHIQDLGFKDIWMPFLKLSLAGAVMSGILLAFDPVLTQWCQSWFAELCEARILEVLKITLLMTIGVAVYLLSVFLLKVPDIQYLLQRLRRKA